MSGNKFQNTGENKGLFTLNVAFESDLQTYLDGIAFQNVENYIRDQFFRIVSLTLQRATYGQHGLEANFSPYEKGTTDILITKNNTDAFGSHLWTDGHMEFSIDHLYSPGLMLHELGHYLYGLGDEFRGCLRDRTKPASIMEYSFGNNVRYRKNGQDKEYKVLGGFDEFWDDHQAGSCALIFKNVVTDFCHDNAPHLKHNKDTDSEHNSKHEKKSCWKVMLMNQNVVINGAPKQNYILKDPFDSAGDLKPEFQTIQESIGQSIEEMDSTFVS